MAAGLYQSCLVVSSVAPGGKTLVLYFVKTFCHIVTSEVIGSVFTFDLTDWDVAKNIAGICMCLRVSGEVKERSPAAGLSL